MAHNIKVAVLGGGHGGRAMAAYLSVIGCDVNLYNRTPGNIHNIQQAKGVFLTYTPELEEEIFPEYVEGLEAKLRHEYSLTPKSEKLIEEEIKSLFCKLNIISPNIKEVLKDRDLIMVTVPATGHKYIADQCAPHIKDGQTIILNPGRCFGAIEFYNAINEYYKGKKAPDVTIAETQTFIYASRRTKPRIVRILGVKNSVAVAAIPAKKTNAVVKLIEPLYPQFTPVQNVLHTSLSNIGGIFHVPITILNTSKIDSRQDFEYYIDGVTEHIAAIIEDMDKERVAVAKAIGRDVISAKKWLLQTYNSKGTNLYEAIQNTHAYKGIESPDSINHRYIWEDIPTSLVPLSSLGKKLGVPTPLIDSFIYQAASALRKDLNIDFFKNGRTMEKLGLKDMSTEEITKFVEEGINN